MPICPVCKTEQSRRVSGACPGCGARVDIHKGYWVRADLGSPALALLKYFENKVSTVLSYGRSASVNYVIPRKGVRYKRELVAAERLIDAADGDYDLAKATIDILFEHPRLNWKTRDSLIYVERDYLLALAIAKSNQTIEREKEKQAQKAFSQALIREDIFS